MRKLFAAFLFGALALCAVAASAADVDGKWVAQVQGRGGNTQEMTFTFKADGNKLTGTTSTRRGETEISDGKIDGDQISFTQSLEFNGNSFKILYTGKVSGDQIEFTRQREGGQGRSMKFTAKKAS